jgi:hypothetical protein
MKKFLVIKYEAFSDFFHKVVKADSLEDASTKFTNSNDYEANKAYFIYPLVNYSFDENNRVVVPENTPCNFIFAIQVDKDEDYKLYKIAHRYNINHLEQSLLIKTKLDTSTLIETLGALDFKFEELVGKDKYMEEKHLIKILEKFFPIKDVTNEYHYFLPMTEMEEEEQWELEIGYEFTDYKVTKETIEIIQIDRYAARESCCGNDYRDLMEKHLPNSIEFENAIKDLKEHYKEDCTTSES